MWERPWILQIEIHSGATWHGKTRIGGAWHDGTAHGKMSRGKARFFNGRKRTVGTRAHTERKMLHSFERLRPLCGTP